MKFLKEKKQSDGTGTNKDLMRKHCRRVVFSVLTSAVGIYYLTFNSLFEFHSGLKSIVLCQVSTEICNFPKVYLPHMSFYSVIHENISVLKQLQELACRTFQKEPPHFLDPPRYVHVFLSIFHE